MVSELRLALSVCRGTVAVSQDDANPYDKFIKDVGPMAMGASTYEWIQRNHPDQWFYDDRPTWVSSHHEPRGAPLLPRRRTKPMTLISVGPASNGTFAHLRYSLH